MCYSYEQLDDRARTRWRHDHPGKPYPDDLQTTAGEATIRTTATESALYPDKRGLIRLLGESDLREGHFRFLPVWATSYNDPRCDNNFNTRGDSILEKPTWRTPFQKKQRCLVKTTGFYEKDKKTKKRYFFSLKEKYIFYYAGLYNWWTNPANGDRILTYSIITTEPNELVALHHHRMPFILSDQLLPEWMQPDTPLDRLMEAMQPYPAELMLCEEAPEAPRKKKESLNQGELF